MSLLPQETVKQSTYTGRSRAIQFHVIDTKTTHFKIEEDRREGQVHCGQCFNTHDFLGFTHVSSLLSSKNIFDSVAMGNQKTGARRDVFCIVRTIIHIGINDLGDLTREIQIRLSVMKKKPSKLFSSTRKKHGPHHKKDPLFPSFFGCAQRNTRAHHCPLVHRAALKRAHM